MQASAITLIDPSTRRTYAAADDDAVILSSGRTGWRHDLVFEVHRMAAKSYEEHILVGHRLIVNLGAPVEFGWHSGDRRREAVLPTGGLCLQSDGDSNAPFWQDELTFAAIGFSPLLVETLLEDRAPRAGETFAERRCLLDPQAYHFARTLAAELSSPTEPLFAEALSNAFVLHLLSAHGISGSAKRLSPRGKLGAVQLRAAVEFAHASLAEGASLDAMAAAAGYSPYQFSRLFRATTGFAPHQFVLRLRLERAVRLLREQALGLAEIALVCGFYDQAHLTNMFRRAYGKTPAAYAATEV